MTFWSSVKCQVVKCRPLPMWWWTFRWSRRCCWHLLHLDVSDLGVYIVPEITRNWGDFRAVELKPLYFPKNLEQSSSHNHIWPPLAFHIPTRMLLNDGIHQAYHYYHNRATAIPVIKIYSNSLSSAGSTFLSRIIARLALTVKHSSGETVTLVLWDSLSMLPFKKNLRFRLHRLPWQAQMPIVRLFHIKNSKDSRKFPARRHTVSNLFSMGVPFLPGPQYQKTKRERKALCAEIILWIPTMAMKGSRRHSRSVIPTSDVRIVGNVDPHLTLRRFIDVKPLWNARYVVGM